MSHLASKLIPENWILCLKVFDVYVWVKKVTNHIREISCVFVFGVTLKNLTRVDCRGVIGIIGGLTSVVEGSVVLTMSNAHVLKCIRPPFRPSPLLRLPWFS